MEASIGSRGVVLVVEDAPLMRMVAAAAVEDAGFETIEAVGAESAIAILEARKDIRIVFADIHMPGSMDGLKLARVVRDRWPPIELILTSGLIKIGQRDLPERSVFLAKPYTLDALTTALARFDDGRKGSATRANHMLFSEAQDPTVTAEPRGSSATHLKIA